ncbi:hypothetical protein Tco_0894470 [Tanacetum coccineum]|uniref:Uncharacterized protein n=1 Tax=Tanacetum coccineum TaxID=301880 RepID=A0ABQ5CD50_9ASTR
MGQSRHFSRKPSEGLMVLHLGKTRERTRILHVYLHRPPKTSSVDYCTKAAKGLQTQMAEFPRRQQGPAEGPAQPDAKPEEGLARDTTKEWVMIAILREYTEGLCKLLGNAPTTELPKMPTLELPGTEGVCD